MASYQSSANERFELTLLRNLIFNEEFTRKALPFLKEDYFKNRDEIVLFNTINNFVLKYNNLPTKEALSVDIGNLKTITEEENKNITRILNELEPVEIEQQWLLDTTEKFCKERAVHNAILSGIKILDGKDKKQNPESIPHILSQALAVSFDQHIGHDYLKQTSDRYDYYHKVETRVKFDLSYFNRITKGGLPPKTLNVALAGTGVGKSLFMCHLASSFIQQGKNVLYITLEMAEERIAERIDANLLDVTIDELYEMPKQYYESKIEKLQRKVSGQLIIKEYPTAAAHTGHFKNLMDELALKKTFKPDVVFIDYLNICASSRFKGGNISSYFYIKAIAEELRGMAVEYNVPIMSATQTTRSGYMSSDVGLEDTSESFGLPATADFMFALITNEELEALNQMKIKQLKNRYSDPATNRAFIIGVDRAKMRLYDVEQKAQQIVDSNQESKEEINKPQGPQPDDTYDKFSGFKV
jgi:archaellum biogenesis ATPase FlaH